MEVDPISFPLPASEARNWSELPVDALSVIFAKLGAIEVLMGAGLVCRSWLEAAKVPDLWRFVDMTRHKAIFKKRISVMCAMARVAVDRSSGKLESFWAQNFVTDDLLKYIGDRTSSLKSIRLISCTGAYWEELITLAAKSPVLEELEHSYSYGVPEEFYKHLGHKCPRLRCLRVNSSSFVLCDEVKYDLMMEQVLHHDKDGDEDEDDDEDVDEDEDGDEDEDEDELYEEDGPWNWPTKKNRDAFAIAESMHELRVLQIINNTLTNAGVGAILDSCPHLELLDLGGCDNVFPDDQLRAKWANLRHVKLSEGWTKVEELRIIGERDGQEDDHLSEDFCCGGNDEEMKDGGSWDDVYWDDISLPSDDGSGPDLGNVDCDDVTQYTYIHDYYSL